MFILAHSALVVLRDYTVSEDETIVIQVKSGTGRFPLWLASVTVQVTDDVGSYQSLPIATGICSVGGVVAGRNGFEWPNMIMTQSQSASHSRSHPITSSPSHSQSTPLHTPQPSQSHTAGCAHYPFNDQDNLLEPYFRVADQNFTTAYTILNPQCQPTLVWQANGNQSLTNAYGYSPYMTLAFPFSVLGIDPNNKSEYVASFDFSMQNDNLDDAGVTFYYQSSCGRFSQVEANVYDVTPIEGGTDCNGGHVWADYNLRYHSVLIHDARQVFREGYERDWGQQDSFVIMITDPDPSQVYYITNFTITTSTGRVVDAIPFYPVDPYSVIDYSDYCPFNHSILDDPPASFAPCRCNACSKEGKNIYFMPPIEVTQSIEVITNPLEYQNELDYYLAREGKGKRKERSGGGGVIDESAGPLFRTEFDTFNFLNPVGASRQEELLDMDSLMDDNGCGVLVFVRDACMGNLEIWLAPDLVNSTNSSYKYLDYDYGDIVGFQCRLVQAISPGTVTNLVWPLTQGVIAVWDVIDVTHTPSDYGQGFDQRDWQDQWRYNVYFSGNSTSFDGHKYGFAMQRSNPDNFTGFYISCDTSLPNYGGPDNLFVPLFSWKECMCFEWDRIAEERVYDR